MGREITIIMLVKEGSWTRLATERRQESAKHLQTEVTWELEWLSLSEQEDQVCM